MYSWIVRGARHIAGCKEIIFRGTFDNEKTVMNGYAARLDHSCSEMIQVERRELLT
jgi:hypothetical protein